MKNDLTFCNAGLRLGIIAAIILASGLACTTSPASPSVQPTSDSRSGLTPPVEFIPLEPLRTAIPSEDVVWEMLGQVDIDRALSDLGCLTGEEPICTDEGCFTIKDRLTGSEGLGRAKNYVYRELVSQGYAVKFQDWSRSGYADQNIIARKPGRVHPEEEIYFVAHLDGAQSPAADDNASGVVDLLELARVLSNYSLSRTVVLLFSTGEEQGTLGVQSHLSQLSASELGSIQFVINIDMVGYDAGQDGGMELWYGDHPPSLDLATTVSRIIQAYQLGLSPGLVTGCG